MVFQEKFCGRQILATATSYPLPHPCELCYVTMLYYMNIRDFIDVIKAANQLALIWGDHLGYSDGPAVNTCALKVELSLHHEGRRGKNVAEGKANRFKV